MGEYWKMLTPINLSSLRNRHSNGNAMVPMKRKWKDRVESLVDKYLIVTPETYLYGRRGFKKGPPEELVESFRGLFIAAGVLSVSYFGMSRGGMWGHHCLLAVPKGCMPKLASMVLVGGYCTTGISMQSKIGLFIYPNIVYIQKIVFREILGLLDCVSLFLH
jgi:hypothetical protein